MVAGIAGPNCGHRGSHRPVSRRCKSLVPAPEEIAIKLIEVTKAFATEEQCLAYLEAKRWPTGVRCLTCHSKEISRITRKVTRKTDNKRAQLFQCLEPTCKAQFSATTGTSFNGSHLSLAKWYLAIALILEANKGMSALQLQRHLKVNYRTAWSLAQRVREALNRSGRPQTDRRRGNRRNVHQRQAEGPPAETAQPRSSARNPAARRTSSAPTRQVTRRHALGSNRAAR
jgi:hypothetical protein